MLESLKSGKKNVGVKQTLKAVENGIAECVFIARDAEPKVITSLKELCQQQSVDIVYVDNMKQLGKACGIEVDAAAACLLRTN